MGAAWARVVIAAAVLAVAVGRRAQGEEATEAATLRRELQAQRLELEKQQELLERVQRRLRLLEEGPASRPAAEAGGGARLQVGWHGGMRIEYEDDAGRRYRVRLRTGMELRYTYVANDRLLYNGSPTGKDARHDEDYNSVNIRRLRFYVDGFAPNPDWSYYVHLQLEPQSSVNLHDAYIRWRRFDALRIRFGRMKVPAFGLEFQQSGFRQNGTDRTIFTGDSEADRDLFGSRTYDWPGSNARLRVGGHRLANGFPAGGFTLYRSQGLNVDGTLDLFGVAQSFSYCVGVYNGRDSKGSNNTDDDPLLTARLGLNLLPGDDPRGPLGPKGLNGYAGQGDYACSATPLLGVVVSAFWDRDRARTFYTVSADADAGFMGRASDRHNIQNFGVCPTLLFRYRGFSADLELAWEQFEQLDTGGASGYDEESWDRWAARVNLGYFLVPREWEVTFKFAYVRRLAEADLKDALQSGLGLVRRGGGLSLEHDLQQYVLGVNWYVEGFHEMITADVAWLRRGLEDVSNAESGALGLPAAAFDPHPGEQNDIRVRVMFQYLF